MASNSAVNSDLRLPCAASTRASNATPSAVRKPTLWNRAGSAYQPMIIACRSMTSFQNASRPSWVCSILRCRASKVEYSGRSRPVGPPTRVSSRSSMCEVNSREPPVMNAHNSGLRRSLSMLSHCAAISIARASFSRLPSSAGLSALESSSALTNSASVRPMRPMFSRLNRAAPSTLAGASYQITWTSSRSAR